MNYILTILIITVLGNDEPVAHTVTTQVQNETFCESVKETAIAEIRAVSPDSQFVSWCAKTGNPVIQSEPRADLRNGGQTGYFPGQ